MRMLSLANRLSGSVGKLVISAVLLVCALGSGWPRTEVLRDAPLPSPNGKLAANVEWESLGFLGLLRMRIFDRENGSISTIEVPEISPNPDELQWLDDEWVMCESFLGEQAVGFFYVQARTRRGYLLEILQPRSGADWNFTVSFANPTTTMSVTCVGRARSSLFPVLLRDCPKREEDYFTLEFCNRLRNAVDAFLGWKHEQGIREFEIVGEADIAEGRGGLVAARCDKRYEVLYFPVGAATPQEMFSRVQRHKLLDAGAQNVLSRRENTDLRPRWLTGTKFTVEVTSSPRNGVRGRQHVVIASGEVAGATDSPLQIALDTDVERGKKANELRDTATITDDNEDLDDAVDVTRKLIATTKTQQAPARNSPTRAPTKTKPKPKRR